MPKRRRSRKHGLPRKKVIQLAQIGTIAVAVLIVVGLAIYLPRVLSSDGSQIEITKDYEPNEKMANSIASNEAINNPETQSVTGSTSESDTNLSESQTESNTENNNNSNEQSNGSSESDVLTSNDSDITTELDNENDMPTSEEGTGASVIDGTDNTTDQANDNQNSQDQLVENGQDGNTENQETADNADVDNSEIIALNDDTTIPEDLSESERIQYVKDAWVNDMINSNIEDINQSDLASGTPIYNKLDTDYLFGLAEGGMTEAEKIEALRYLKSNLSDTEFALALELYNKYIGLVN